GQALGVLQDVAHRHAGGAVGVLRAFDRHGVILANGVLTMIGASPMPPTPAAPPRLSLAPMPDGPLPQALDLSIVAPAHNEEENIARLVEEVGRAAPGLGLSWE